MRLFKRHIGLILAIGLWTGEGMCAQETVFSGMQSNWKKAQKNFQRGSYRQALQYYLAAEPQKKTPKEVTLRIAETYVKLNDNRQAVEWFEKYLDHQGMLPENYFYQMAESLASLGEYNEAIKWYQKYGEVHPDDNRVMQKIWRLKNIDYLFEDSTYYSVVPLSFNTLATEYAPFAYNDQLIYVSNRDGFGGVKVLDGVNKQPFYKRYQVQLSWDSLQDRASFDVLKPFELPFDSKHHQGPISFSSDHKYAVFTQSSEKKDDQGHYPLQLYYSEKVGSTWGPAKPILLRKGYDHTIGNAVISTDGSTVYYSAKFPGGYGGKDLYKSVRSAEGWGSAQNLGSTINTSGDEDYPFVHENGVLYFASNGHSGLGGLDLFEVALRGPTKNEVKNLGYPVNTPYNDFGIYLNKAASGGFISSNRSRGGVDDDIYLLEIDLQTYPLTIKGTLKFRNAQWEEDLRIELLSAGRMQLIDVYNGRLVYETESGPQGDFTLEIPYSSQFKIKVEHQELGEHSASLEIPKNKKEHLDHEIIIVQDQFKEDFPPGKGKHDESNARGHEGI